MIEEHPRSPRGAGGLVRARVRADVHGKDEEGRRPAWGRAEPDLPRGALGPWPRDFGICGGRPSPAANALSAFARTRREAGTGEAAARMPGNAPSCAKNPGGRGPWSDRCEGSVQHRVNRAPLARPPATDPSRREPPRRESPLHLSRCRPALERLRKRPSRTGRAQSRMMFQPCQGLCSRKRPEAPARLPGRAFAPAGLPADCSSTTRYPAIRPDGTEMQFDHLRRREFALVGGAAAAWPVSARAQQQPARIGFLGSTSAARFGSRIEAFRSGLRDLGYVEGKTIVIAFRWADEKYDQLPALAAELVRENVDVIVTHGTPGTRAAKHATAAIPIVVLYIGDAVAAGVVASLRQPGGNVTARATSCPSSCPSASSCSRRPCRTSRRRLSSSIRTIPFSG